MDCPLLNSSTKKSPQIGRQIEPKKVALRVMNTVNKVLKFQWRRKDNLNEMQNIVAFMSDLPMEAVVALPFHIMDGKTIASTCHIA